MIHLRTATIADLPTLLHWDEQPHVIESDPNDDWEWETELQRSPDWREQLIAELDGRPIGFVQIIDPAREETHYWGEVPHGLRAIDIWIGEATNTGKGYGTEMMRLALARCFADPLVTTVLIDPLASNVAAQRFYERLGFQFVDRRMFGEDDTFVYRLERSRFLPPTPLAMRPATSADAEVLSQLITESAYATLSQHYSEVQMAAFLDYYSPSAMRGKISSQSVFCAEMSGQLIGTVALSGEGSVVGFYTHPNYLGRGVGAAMMRHIEQFAKQKGHREIQLTASPVGLGFYLKQGWERVSDYLFTHLDVGFEETLMRKRLVE